MADENTARIVVHRYLRKLSHFRLNLKGIFRFYDKAARPHRISPHTVVRRLAVLVPHLLVALLPALCERRLQTACGLPP